MTARRIYITFLSVIVLSVIVGKIVLAWHGDGPQEGLIAIGAVSMGALATLALVADRPEKPIPPPTPPPPPVPPITGKREADTEIKDPDWPQRDQSLSA